MASTLSSNSALRLKALLLFAFTAASSVPSPLYAIYRAEWGFSPATLTAVFAVYVISMLLTLLTLAPLSDHLGRRPVVLGAIVVELASMLLFLGADSVGWLVAARLVQGAATGVAFSVLGAGLADLDRQRAPLINTAAPLLGLGAGALISSVMAAHAPAPTRLVYLLVSVVLAVLGWRARRLPETVVARPGLLGSMRPRLAVPATSRHNFLRVLPIDVACWALGGFFLSLGPTLARQVTGWQSPVAGGVMIAALTCSGAMGSLLLRHRAAQQLMRIGSTTLTAGVAVVLLSTELSSAFLFFAGSVVAGLGFGVGFTAAMRTAMARALPAERASLMAAFLVVSYFAFSLPALAAGAAIGHFGLLATSETYGALVMVLGIVALAGSVTSPEPSSAAG
ncbi:MFS transporter [Xylophilus sp. GOD-11R]|uniref:MFS transporter n=1 Tax=Xylophilus sp. GOD-11R TaxID=3089814 RepID=UPI00298BCA75|nr:MFS transporter [Xylophilus sp. GOD-11R]WPB58941.1 MFS transporter [Xylophilus sp. GOD-11R]